MMRTRAITIGLIASLATACAAAETRADYSRICLDEEGVRVEDNLCPDNDQRGGDAMVGYFYPVWLYGRYPAPAVGAKPSADSYTHHQTRRRKHRTATCTRRFRNVQIRQRRRVAVHSAHVDATC